MSLAMHRPFCALAVFASLWMIAVAGDDPAVPAAALAKKLANTPTLSEFSLKPLAAAPDDVRKEFFQTLGQTKISEGNRVIICLNALKKDTNEDVRLAAATSLANLKSNKSAMKALSDLLADRSLPIRKLACENLIGVRGDPTLGPRFSKMMYDPSSDLRQASVRALGKLNDRTQVPAILAAYKKFKSAGDDDAAYGEALANLGEDAVSLEIARVCLKSRNHPTRIAAANILECNSSMKVIPVIMENLVLELHRTTTLDPKQPNWDVVYVTMCSELIRRTGTNFTNDAVGWCRWWDGVRVKYNAPAPAFDAAIVGRWMDSYRKMGPSKLRE